MGNEKPYIEDGQIGKNKGAVIYNILHRATGFFS
jgi:succinate dehydrogenase/fumarate reductase cytochrome b subunit